jgi:hypothetical protein
MLPRVSKIRNRKIIYIIYHCICMEDLADSLHSCFLKNVALGKEQIVDVTCAALMDLDEEIVPIAAKIF